MSSSKASVKGLVKKPNLLGNHRGKESNKFQFDVVVERVFGASSSEYSLKWCRGVKTATSKRFHGEPKNKDGVEINQKLSLLCTLYRAKALEGPPSFEPKDSKISLVSHRDAKKNDKTVGKVHFDLSEFAGVPSASTRHTFTLNSKTQVQVTIGCTFLRASRGTASSAGSAMSGMTVSSGEVDDLGGNDDFADLDLDLPKDGIDDIASPVSDAGDPASKELGESRATAQKPTDSFTPADHEPPQKDGSAEPRDSTASSTGGRSRGKLFKSPVSASSVVSFKGKAKIAALETEVEEVRQQLADSRKETEKARVLNQMSEDIIRELREKIEYAATGASTSSHVKEQELQEKLDIAKKKLATADIDHQRVVENYESRITVLKAQVDTMERSKTRLQKEKEDKEEEMATLRKLAQKGKSKDDEESVQREAREKLMAEVSTLRDAHEAAVSDLKTEKSKYLGLETRLREASLEVNRLQAKLDAHEEHSGQVKSTYEDLSKMYNDLREDHLKLQTDLKEARKIAQTASNEKSRFLRKSKKEKDDSSSPDESAAIVAECEELRKEVQEKRRCLVEAEKLKVDAEQKLASMKGDLKASNAKLSEALQDIDRANELADSTKAKYLTMSEQLEDALQANKDLEVQFDGERSKHREELLKQQTERAEETKRLRQAATAAAAAAATGADSQVKHLEQSLKEASEREDRYEEEILKMTKIVDGLNQNLSEASAAAAAAQELEEAHREELRELARKREQDCAHEIASGGQASSERSRRGSKAAEARHRGEEGIDGGVDTASGRVQSERNSKRRNQDDAPPGGDSASDSESDSSGRSTDSKRVASEQGFESSDPNASFISSSRIRQTDLMEKITDGRLLNMLVETKMKLAVAEEEKVSACADLGRTYERPTMTMQRTILTHLFAQCSQRPTVVVRDDLFGTSSLDLSI